MFDLNLQVEYSSFFIDQNNLLKPRGLIFFNPAPCGIRTQDLSGLTHYFVLRGGKGGSWKTGDLSSGQSNQFRSIL